MPQLLKLAGYKPYWSFRGVRSSDTPSEFLWEGIDGTRIPVFWLPFGYSNFYGTPGYLTGFERAARQRFETLSPFARGNDRVALAGANVAEPEENLPAMVEKFNQRGDEPFVIRFGVPADFEAVVAQRGDRPVVSGELNPIFQGFYSSRLELKQRMRDLERLLMTAEKLAVLARWLGGTVDAARLMQAWEPELFNQTHDLFHRILSAREASLIEHAGRELKTSNEALQFDLGPFEIKTFKLRFRPYSARVALADEKRRANE